MIRIALTALLAAVVSPALAPAHMVFVVPSADGKTARVVFSESLEPDDQYTNAARSFVSAVQTGGPTSGESVELAQFVDAVREAAR